MRVTQVRRSYDPSFQQDAVALLQRTDRPIHGVARDLGVPFTTLYGWYKRAMAKKGKRSSLQDKALPISDPSAEAPEEKIARLEREVTELRKENDSLKLDRAILKKAAAFFAKESE
jgi:transposase